MPIYEYKCQACGHEFEVIQKITDKPKRKCESCGKLKAKRLISQTSFVLKGGGWYATDYGNRRASSQKESKARTDAALKEADSKPAKSDAAENKGKKDAAKKAS